MTSQEKIKYLVDTIKLTKYGIAKTLEVRWSTIQRWYLGHNNPDDRHKMLLNKLYRKYSVEDNVSRKLKKEAQHERVFGFRKEEL